MKYPVLLPNIFDHPFTYESDIKLNIGQYVEVPFGKNTLNGVSDTMIELIDIAGTIYDYSNIDPSYWHFGKSIKNFIEQKTDNHREEVFTEGGRLLSLIHI